MTKEPKWTKGPWNWSERNGEVMTQDQHDGDDFQGKFLRKFNKGLSAKYMGLHDDLIRAKKELG